MKIKELITELQKFDSELDVKMDIDWNYADISNVGRLKDYVILYL